MPGGIEKPKSSRTSSRIQSALSIYLLGFPPDVACRRCSFAGVGCFCLEDGRCSNCVRSGMEKDCNVEGLSYTAKELVQKRAELQNVLKELAVVAVKANNLSLTVGNLEDMLKDE